MMFGKALLCWLVCTLSIAVSVSTDETNKHGLTRGGDADPHRSLAIPPTGGDCPSVGPLRRLYCLLTSNCPQACTPRKVCSTKTGKGCSEGYSCTLRPGISCIQVEGADCPGICAPTCNDITADPQLPCPDGTSCVDNYAAHACRIADNCTGVCLPPPSCDANSGQGCREGSICVLDPNIVCLPYVGATCPGICIP